MFQLLVCIQLSIIVSVHFWLHSDKLAMMVTACKHMDIPVTACNIGTACSASCGIVGSNNTLD